MIISIPGSSPALTLIRREQGSQKETVEFYWLDDYVERIELAEDKVTILWRDGDMSIAEMDISDEYYYPTRYSDFYNDYLKKVSEGGKKNKYKHLMGLDRCKTQMVTAPVGKTRIIRRRAAATATNV